MEDKKKVCKVKDIWNVVIEQIIAEIGERSKCMSVLCSFAYKYYDRQRTYLLVPASIISWGLNIFGMISTYLGTEVISESLVVLIASIGNFVTATITTVAEKSKAGDKVELFNQASKDFHLIYSEISTQLSFEPQLRTMPHDFFRQSDERYKRLLQSIPNIPDSVVLDFRSKYHHNDVFFPDHLAGFGLNKVRIYRPSNEEKYANMLATAGDKLMKKPNKKWIIKPINDKISDTIIDVKDTNVESKSESKDIPVNISEKNVDSDIFFDSEMGGLIDEKPKNDDKLIKNSNDKLIN